MRVRRRMGGEKGKEKERAPGKQGVLLFGL